MAKGAQSSLSCLFMNLSSSTRRLQGGNYKADLHAAGNYPQSLNQPPSSVSSEEPLAHVAYTYDGSLEGLLSAIFEAYLRHEDPEDVAPDEGFCPRLGQSVRFVESNLHQALRVQRSITQYCGMHTFDAIRRASLSDQVDTGIIVYRFVRFAVAQSGWKAHAPETQANQSISVPRQTCYHLLDELAHPAVEPLHKLLRAVNNERHRMVQFLRFEHLENDVWFARCNPMASVVPLLMDWFAARFNVQPFIIYDEVHNLAGVYEGSSWYLLKTNKLTIAQQATDEKLMTAAWKRFYRTVAVEARYNPELRRQFMPKRLWKNIIEMHEDLASSNSEFPGSLAQRCRRRG